MLYHRMYQIAKFYPDKIKQLDARDLSRARLSRTAVAYWTVPLAVEKWSADAVGTMNEAFIPELIETLEREGKSGLGAHLARPLGGQGRAFRQQDAEPLRVRVRVRLDRFRVDGRLCEVRDDARGATGCDAGGRAQSGFRDRVSYEAALKFMNFQLLLNMSDRGWLETTYYQLGSDYRGNLTYLLSYMSQMGGWSILDYALHFAKDPTDYAPPRLRIVAQFVGARELRHCGERLWLLVPEQGKRRRRGGGFMPEAIGRAWIGKEMPRGAWHYSAEEDVGYAGALRSNATIVARDPVFGEIAYGGVLTRDGKSVKVDPARRPARALPRHPRRSAPAPGPRSRRLREGAAGHRGRRSVARAVRPRES